MITLQEMSALSTLYAQKHRHYHDITHIMNCLSELEQYQINTPSVLDFSTQQYEIVETAIWYHDAIYNPYSKENEGQSSLLLENNHRSSVVGVISDAIYVTSKHTEIVDFARYTGGIEYEQAYAVLLDIDLSGFGKSWEEYKRNGENIRKEYYNTSDRDFFTGRLKFLLAIAKKQTLYYTDYFSNKYHEQSCKNLEQDIKITRDILHDLDPARTDAMLNAIYELKL